MTITLNSDDPELLNSAQDNGGAPINMQKKPELTDTLSHLAQDAIAPNGDLPPERPMESGGPAGLEPTRYGDWEKKGRCSDF